MGSRPDRLTVGDQVTELDERLDAELSAYNLATSGVHDQAECTVRIEEDGGELVARMSGWTWRTCAGISLVWAREDRRAQGTGACSVITL